MGSKYFADTELMCKCCGTLPEGGMSEKLLELLDDIRESIGKPVSLSCAYRCPSHNAEVGGVPNSQHVLGEAADILVPDDKTVEEVAQLAESLNADGVGRYNDSGFVHVDVRSGRIGDNYRWDG